MPTSRPAKRPQLPKPTEETRRAAALLAEEILGWPEVTEKPMFGMRCFYRNGVVFALLPNKRALERADAIAYKLPKAGASSEGEKWLLHTVDDRLQKAIAVLQRAWKAAG